MNLRDLEYVVKIAEERHFGRAAEACHVSQSTLSIQIKKLEDMLGVTLFERSNKKLLLSAVGEKIVARARDILQQAEDIKTIAREAVDPFAGELSIGAFPTLAPYFFPLCTSALREHFPQLSMQLVEEKTDDLLGLLESGKLDCALIAAPLERSGLRGIELFYEPFLLAVPTAHALSAKSAISDTDLENLSLLLLDEGHCLRAQALEICHTNGSSEARKFRATSLETLRQMVALGQAITLLPALAVRADDPAICHLPFETKQYGRQILLCFRAISARSALFSQLSAILSACAHSAGL